MERCIHHKHTWLRFKQAIHLYKQRSYCCFISSICHCSTKLLWRWCWLCTFWVKLKLSQLSHIVYISSISCNSYKLGLSLFCLLGQLFMFVFCVSGVCIFCFLVFGCWCQCNRLPGKTHLQNDLVCVEWDVKPYTLTHSPRNSYYCSNSYYCFLLYYYISWQCQIMFH